MQFGGGKRSKDGGKPVQTPRNRKVEELEVSHTWLLAGVTDEGYPKAKTPKTSK